MGTLMPGDLNGNGQVDAVDTVLLYAYLAGNLELNSRQLEAADVDRDGELTLMDVVLMQRMQDGLYDWKDYTT